MIAGTSALHSTAEIAKPDRLSEVGFPKAAISRAGLDARIDRHNVEAEGVVTLSSFTAETQLLAYVRHSCFQCLSQSDGIKIGQISFNVTTPSGQLLLRKSAGTPRRAGAVALQQAQIEEPRLGFARGWRRVKVASTSPKGGLGCPEEMCSLARYSVDKANGQPSRTIPTAKRKRRSPPGRRNPFRGRVVRMGLRAEGCPTLRSGRHAASADLHLHPFIYSRDKRPAQKAGFMLYPCCRMAAGRK